MPFHYSPECGRLGLGGSPAQRGGQHGRHFVLFFTLKAFGLCLDVALVQVASASPPRSVLLQVAEPPPIAEPPSTTFQVACGRTRRRSFDATLKWGRGAAGEVFLAHTQRKKLMIACQLALCCCRPTMEGDLLVCIQNDGCSRRQRATQRSGVSIVCR